ncbi:MAG: hypothetical protein M0P01_13890 [Treponema sp.]|nr:hypothetical protein [Treponema sp.]
MKMTTLKRFVLPACMVSLLSLSLSAQSHISTQAHQSIVSAVAAANYGGSQKTFFSAGEDGFLIKWTDDGQGENYQISDLQIKLAAAYPEKNLVAVYETDSGLINRVSVWDFNSLSRIYARRFTDSVTSLTFSAGGTYLIVGTATVDGAVFLRTTDGSVVDKIKSPTGILSYASTSSSEKTLCTYSPVGTISYYNMQTGRLKGKFPTAAGLSQVTTYNNDMLLSGIKDNTVFIISALSGDTIASYAASSPLILADKSDKNLYYLENNERNGYTLMEIESNDNKSVSTPQIVKKFKTLTGDTICCGTKEGAYIMLGSYSGSLFRTDSSPDTTLLSFYSLTDNIYDKICDMSPAGEDFYFLTGSAVYKSSYDSGIVNKLADNPGQTQIATYGTSLILWSKGTRRPVQLLDLDTKNLTPLFTPKSNIQSVRIFGNVLLEMESNMYVNAYHFDTQQFEKLYSGTALQDAVIIGNTIYISKSAATAPSSPLLGIDLTTKETVPLDIDGNVIYSLSCTDTVMYGIVVKTDKNSKKTVLFSYNPERHQISTLLSLADEDTDAFTCLHNNEIYTDIGNDKFFSYNLSNRKTTTYNRSASLPVKVCQNTSRLVVLNKDGSVSWYNAGIQQVLADWYLTLDGNWYEF